MSHSAGTMSDSDSSVDPSLWNRAVSSGRALVEHWTEGRPGRVRGTLDAMDALADVAAETEGQEGATATDSARVPGSPLARDLSHCSGSGGPSASSGHQLESHADAAPGAVGAAASAASVRGPRDDSPIRGHTLDPVAAADPCHVPDLAGPTEEADWFNAAASFEGSVSAPVVPCNRNLEYLDLFAGGGVVSTVFAGGGHAADVYDIAVDPTCDILSARGFAVACDKIARVRAGGLAMAGPPCSLWTFLSSSVHRRSDQCPQGDTTNRKVRMSNALVSNLCVLLQWAHSRGVYWVLEQPATSRMWEFAPVEALLQDCGAVRVFTHMGSFGHRQPKPTVLWGTLPSLPALARARSDVPWAVRGQTDPEVVGYKRDCRGRVAGNQFLHASATYTADFGRALLEVWRQDTVAVASGAATPRVVSKAAVPPAGSALARGRAAVARRGRGRGRCPLGRVSLAAQEEEDRTSMCPE